jgi:hypothetical protein
MTLRNRLYGDCVCLVVPLPHPPAVDRPSIVCRLADTVSIMMRLYLAQGDLRARHSYANSCTATRETAGILRNPKLHHRLHNSIQTLVPIVSQTLFQCWSNIHFNINLPSMIKDRLCGLVVRVLGYRSGGPGSIPGTTKIKRVVGLERGPLSLVSTTEVLLDIKVAAPV